MCQGRAVVVITVKGGMVKEMKRNDSNRDSDVKLLYYCDNFQHV